MVSNFNFLLTAQELIASEDDVYGPFTEARTSYATACALVAIAQELKRHNDRIEADVDREEKLAEYRNRHLR